MPHCLIALSRQCIVVSRRHSTSASVRQRTYTPEQNSQALNMSNPDRIVDAERMQGGLAVTFGDNAVALLRDEWVRNCAVQHSAFVDMEVSSEETGDENEIVSMGTSDLR